MKKQNQTSSTSFSETFKHVLRQQDEDDLILRETALHAGRCTYLRHKTHTMYILNQMAHRHVISYEQARVLIQQEVEQTKQLNYTLEKS